MPGFAAQSDFAVRFEWGIHGVTEVAGSEGVTIIVDVLSFSSCVEIACSRGALVLPHRFGDDSAEAHAREQRAVLACGRGGEGWSLSPASLLDVPAGTRLVLPSPNGSTLSLASRTPRVVAGCLRNAAAVAAFASRQPGPVTVVAAGERWPDGSLRPAVEDLLGAGAILRHLPGRRSPEAAVAELAFAPALQGLGDLLRDCASGIELRERGFARDVELAAMVDASACVPVLEHGAYRAATE